MIKVVVDTEEELNVVRRVLETETCSHSTCPDGVESRHIRCGECVDKYCENQVILFKKEIVETPAPLVV